MNVSPVWWTHLTFGTGKLSQGQPFIALIKNNPVVHEHTGHQRRPRGSNERSFVFQPITGAHACSAAGTGRSGSGPVCL